MGRVGEKEERTVLKEVKLSFTKDSSSSTWNFRRNVASASASSLYVRNVLYIVTVLHIRMCGFVGFFLQELRSKGHQTIINQLR